MGSNESGRIEFIDTLRGVALLGILLMNVQSFGHVAAYYLNPTALGPMSSSDTVLWALVHLVADQKFLGLFAMLFGAGLCLYHDRAEARGADSRRLHRRRMGFLVLFGALHATLVWHGDVLFCYGVVGLIVAPARRWSPRKLVTAAVVVAACGSSLWLIGGLTVPLWPPDMLAEVGRSWSPSSAARAVETSAYLGSWWQQMSVRLPQAFENEVGGLLFLMGFKSGSAMLLGMALYRSNIINGQAERSIYQKLIVLGLVVGVPLTCVGMAADSFSDFSLRFSFFFGQQINYWASFFVSLMWLGCVALAMGRFPRAQARLAAVGRTAFSNYILHSVLGTWVFYGHGLGRFGSLNRTGLLVVVVALWVVSLVGAPLWLTRFRQGPLEALWRRLTNGAAASEL